MFRPWWHCQASKLVATHLFLAHSLQIATPHPSVPLLVPHCHVLLAPLSLWRSAASAASPYRRMINDSPHIITKCKQTALKTTSEESAMQNILHPMSYSLPKAGVNILAAFLHQVHTLSNESSLDGKCPRENAGGITIVSNVSSYAATLACPRPSPSLLPLSRLARHKA